ncbi:MAG: Crp/Fnr family transcriptional regulator [Methylobacteriaceae bacterium]|nr:Crp/Fnr family transcriptional regulator [Methylobacteriaceae bacterium]
MLHSPLNRLVRKLEADGRELAPAEKEAVLRLPFTLKEVRADHDIVRQGDRPTQCCLVIDGFLCRYKMLPDGERQIVSFHVPGEIPDLQSLFLGKMDHALTTISPSTVAFIAHEAMNALIEGQPKIGRLFWRETLIDAAIFREWIVNTGSRDAYARIAHLLCELFHKLQAVGLTKGTSFGCPITQTEVADATGLSTVHVNRSVQELRGNRLIEWERGTCTILDLQALEDAAMFEPEYLHLAHG